MSDDTLHTSTVLRLLTVIRDEEGTEAAKEARAELDRRHKVKRRTNLKVIEGGKK